jgi:hypothetical protein
MRTLFLLLLAWSVTPTHAADNLLRNGSFEGGKRYWFEIDRYELVPDPAHGTHALKIDKGGIQSAAFLLQPGKAVTLSFSARTVSAPAGVMGWQMSPCAREVGVKAGQTWGMRGRHPVKLTNTWQRFSFEFTPTAPQDGFWPRPTYMVQLGDNDQPMLLDAVTVAYDAGKEGYVPWKAVEVQSHCPDLKGYRDPSFNLLQKGQDITLVGTAFNAGTQPRTLTLRWQLIDYEGTQPVGPALERSVIVPAGQVVRETVQTKLTATGTVLARVSALDDQGSVIDQSDLPLSSLPYPKAPTKPDWRERFGGSPQGWRSAEAYQKMGFAWTRWWPHMNWADHQPNGPDEWKWFDKELDHLEKHGQSGHCVLMGWPKWAFDAKSKPLPKDMQWPANDPRWDDLTPQCGWDRFVIGCVQHYKGRSLVYEIINEPEFDHWEKHTEQYVKFNVRTARLIKQTDPNAKVMVDNVYGIPSGINSHLFKAGSLKYIDIFSWHDYHAGWLADATAMKRMRQNLDEAGGKHVEIWFNEGWAYTNTIVDEPAVALTHLNSAQSTNAMVCSVAEVTIAGQDKCILFQTGQDTHGHSFWDYAGPGTQLWDWYGYPMPLVPAWNTLSHHVGLSDRVDFIRPENTNCCIFQDLRNERGVIVAYADRDSSADAVLALPDVGAAWQAEDCMGNAVPLTDGKLMLRKSGRPVYLWTAAKTPGKVFADKLAPLDRKHLGFVNAAGTRYRLPAAWDGSAKGKPTGNPALAGTQPIWRLDQLWPTDASKPANYKPMIWTGTDWNVGEGGFGGQPGARVKDGTLTFGIRAPHGQPMAERVAGVTFIAPKAGQFSLSGSVDLRNWDGTNPVDLALLHKTADAVKPLTTLALVRNQRVSLAGLSATVAAGDELVLLPRPHGAFGGADVNLRDLAWSVGPPSAWRLPTTWVGTTKDSPVGNPNGVWRLDQVWPDNPVFTEHYTPLRWNGKEWFPEKHHIGGQPAAQLDKGAVNLSVRGSWTGQEGQRIAGLVFVAPQAGQYRISASASTKPWEGGAKTFKLAVLKKDTQRAVELKSVDLPREGKAITLELEIELAAGHEIVFLPQMPDFHNATTTTLRNVVVERVGGQ